MAPQTPPADDPVPQLVGQVFETAPAAERRRLLAYLIKPLSLLSLVAVANGMFARYRLGPAWASCSASVPATSPCSSATCNRSAPMPSMVWRRC